VVNSPKSLLINLTTPEEIEQMEQELKRKKEFQEEINRKYLPSIRKLTEAIIVDNLDLSIVLHLPKTTVNEEKKKRQ
jgi:hypothetical protein